MARGFLAGSHYTAKIHRSAAEANECCFFPSLYAISILGILMPVMVWKSKITEAEWPIMKFLWERKTATAAQIVEHISKTRDVSMRTIKTLLRRLLAKEMVGFTVDPRDSRIYHYTPLVGERESLHEKSRSMLKLLSGGDACELLAHFVENVHLRPGEIDRLRALLEEKSKGMDKD